MRPHLTLWIWLLLCISSCGGTQGSVIRCAPCDAPTTGAPLHLVTLPARTGDQPVRVRFFDDAGFDVVVPAASHDPIRVAVPPWFSPEGEHGAGEVSLELLTDDGEVVRLRGTMSVRELPSAPGAPGDVTREVLRGVRKGIADAEFLLSMFDGNIAPYAAPLARVRVRLRELDEAIERWQDGELPDGAILTIDQGEVMLDERSLALSDALLYALVVGDQRVDPAARYALAGDFDGEAWFRDMVRDVVQGSLEDASTLASGLGAVTSVLGVVAAVTGAPAAGVAVGTLGALTWATTTLVPAMHALVLNTAGTMVGHPDVPPPPAEVWEATRPGVEYLAERTFDQALDSLGDRILSPETPLGESVVDTLQTAMGFAPYLADAMSQTIFGDMGTCPDGSLPDEIGFNPSYIVCDRDEAPTVTDPESGSGSGGGGGGDGPPRTCPCQQTSNPCDGDTPEIACTYCAAASLCQCALDAFPACCNPGQEAACRTSLQRCVADNAAQARAVGATCR